MLSIRDTGLLYIFIYGITTFFALFSQSKQGGRIVFERRWLLAAFFIHWIFMAFTDIGTDYEHYVRNVKHSIEGFETIIEFGFNGLCFILYKITRSPHITLFLVKTIELSILYYGFYRLRTKEYLWLAVFAYNAIVYLQGINLLSMHFCIVLLFLSFVYLLEEEKKKAIFALIAACTVHSSAFLLVPIYIVFYIIGTSDRRMSGFMVLLLILSVVGVVSIYDIVFNYAVSQLAVFEQYAHYEIVNKARGSGLMQLFYFSPIFFFTFYQFFYLKAPNYQKNLAIVFSLFAFSYAMLGYKLEVFARINMNFLGIYAAMVPSMLFAYQNKTRNKANYQFFLLFWILTLFVRAFFVLRSNLDVSSQTGVEHYRFFFPF